MIKTLLMAKPVKDITTEDFQISHEVDIEAFLSSDQTDMPTLLAQSINESIAFLDAVERDLMLRRAEVVIVPTMDEHGDCYAAKVLSEFYRDDPLSVSESTLLATYMFALEFTTTSEFPAMGTVTFMGNGVYKVVITVNNDETGDIVDKTQAAMLVKFDTSDIRWSISFYGSYDIETDSYYAADGETKINLEQGNEN